MVIVSTYEAKIPLALMLIVLYTGWPRINGTVDTVDFQDFALINN